MDNAANGNLPAQVFGFYSDSAHGWVHVPWSVLKRLSISPYNFSDYSKADTDGLYLEEDEDFPRFEAIFLSKERKRVALLEQDRDAEVRSKLSIRRFLNRG